jgi:hypothetical protein
MSLAMVIDVSLCRFGLTPTSTRRLRSAAGEAQADKRRSHRREDASKQRIGSGKSCAANQPGVTPLVGAREIKLSRQAALDESCSER